MKDIEIAQAATLQPLEKIAAKIHIPSGELEYFGKNKAKISERFLQSCSGKPYGKLILVTAINPTPAGEGKTTTTIGLADALSRLGHRTSVALREPSLGPVFGMKGGATGGGYAQVVPMEDINLHFTGDIHAITAANNLLCALIDNHIHQGNDLNLDPASIVFKRSMDMNDRALRHIQVAQGGPSNGIPREDGFQITVASEVMAILCLASNISDLKERLGKILVGYTFDGKPLFAKDFHANGAMSALLVDAIKPNLVQTLEGTPCIIHGGPFANIAHGCNSIRATKLSLACSDYTVTEAGFGSDLGAEKFLDIKCPIAGIQPDAIVLVATVRALKYNGGISKDCLQIENCEALSRGLENLEAHIEHLQKFSLPIVVAINRFHDDSDAELSLISECCKNHNVRFAVSEVFEKGGNGGLDLAKQVLDVSSRPNGYAPLYNGSESVEDKIMLIAKEIYGAAGVEFSPICQKQLEALSELGLSHAPVCIAKTQYSLSDDAKLLGRPTGFTLHIREIRPSCGAGFVVALAGSILTMPGLPKNPAACDIDVSDDGKISGLF